MKEETNVKVKTEDTLAKIAITKDADRALVEIYNRVSDGFDAGRVTKQDIASQLILRFVAICKESDIHDMRKGFFDPILAMEAKLRKAKETGAIPDSLREILFEEFMSANPQPTAKRPKKNLQSNLITDKVEDNQEVA